MIKEEKGIEERFISVFQRLGSISGMDSLTCRIYGTLYLEPKDMTMEDLAERTGYSLSSISNKIRALESAGIIKKSKKPGSKKVYLFVIKDMLKNFKDIMVKKQQYGISFAKQELPDIIEDCKDKEKKKIIEGYLNVIMKADLFFKHAVKLMDDIEQGKIR